MATVCVLFSGAAIEYYLAFRLHFATQNFTGSLWIPDSRKGIVRV